MGGKQLLEHVMRYNLVPNVFKNNLHWRIVRKAAILLIEAKMGWVEMQNKGGRRFPELLQDIRWSSN